MPRKIQSYISKLRVCQKSFTELKQQDMCKMCGLQPDQLFVHFLASCPALTHLRQNIYQQATDFPKWDLNNETQTSHNILSSQHRRQYKELIPMLIKFDIYHTETQ